MGTIRGAHSTGIFGVGIDATNKVGDNLLVYKRDVAGYDFAQLKYVEKTLTNIDKYKFFIGHHRHATAGLISSKTAHPFSHGNITLVHNGSLTHLSRITNNSNEFDVDSEALTYALSTSSYGEILPKIKGAAALAWYDKAQDILYLYRNKERPLFFAKVKNEETTFIASEMWMLKGLLWRNGLELENIWDVGENQVVSFKDKATPYKTEIIEPVKEETTPYQNDWPARRNYSSQGKRVKIPVNSAEVFASIGVKEGQKIRFILNEIRLNDKSSKHGKADGYMTVSPFADVVCYGMDTRKYKPTDIIEAEVTGAEIAEHGLDYALILVRPRKVGVAKEEVSNILHLPLIKEDTRVEGPDKKLITVEEFKKLTESGCDNCTASINLAFANKMLWSNANKPICHVCADELTGHGAIKH